MRKILVAGCAAALLALAGCGTTAATTTMPKAPASTSTPSQAPKAAPSATPVIQGGVIIPPAGYNAILHLGQTAGMDAAAQQPAGVNETWTLTSVHYISYAQSQEGRADSTDVAQQLGANEPLPSDQFVVLGITVKNAGTEPDSSPVISGQESTDTVYWGTEAGKIGQTRAYSVDSTATGVLAPYASNAQPTSVNVLNSGQSITGYVVFEVPDAPSAILVGTSAGNVIIMVDPLHLTQASTCAVTAKSC